MAPPRNRLDPEGYYARLGLAPSADRDAIVAAFRVKARQLHPDVPKTGNAAAFVALKQAYDILSNPDRRDSYDRKAREATPPPPPRPRPRPVVFPYGFNADIAKTWEPRPSHLAVPVLAALAVFFCIGLFQIYRHVASLDSAPPTPDGIRPYAQTVEPLSKTEHEALLYGPKPLRLAGVPNFYVRPGGTPAIVWRPDPATQKLLPLGQLPPFSAVQAIRLIRQTGMLEILLDNKGTGFVAADHLAPGNVGAAWEAYCSYNAGPPPFNGELLERQTAGTATLALQNRAMEPIVVKLRNAAGQVAISVYLDPDSHAEVQGLPEGAYRVDYAIGEVWSRACNSFAAGLRAKRMPETVHLSGKAQLVLSDDDPDAANISEKDFAQE